MNFYINGFKWLIKELPEDTIIKRLQEREEEKITCAFGLCDYTIHEIWINKDMCEDQKIATLAHELTHCYMWNIGVVCNEYPVEILCDMAYGLVKFVNDIMTKYEKRRDSR